MEQGGVHVGDVVTLAVDSHGARGTPFKVVGVYEPTPNPMKFSARRLEARLHLPDLLALTDDPGDPLSGETVESLNIALVDPREASTGLHPARHALAGAGVASDGDDHGRRRGVSPSSTGSTGRSRS